MGVISKFIKMLTSKPAIKPDTEYFSLVNRIKYLSCKAVDISYFRVITVLLPIGSFIDLKKNVKEASLYLRVNDKTKFERTILGNTEHAVTLYDLFLSNCVLCDRLEEFKEFCIEFLDLLDKRHNDNEPIFYNESRLFKSILTIITALEKTEISNVSE